MRRKPTLDLSFEAALPPAPRKALQLDADGEAILTLAVPASDAQAIAERFTDLMDRSFVVTLKLA